MNLIDVENALIEGLVNQMGEYGFRFVKSQKAFIKKKNGVSEKVILGVYDAGSHVLVEPALAISFKDIGDIYNRFSGVSKKARANYSTVLAPIKKISSNMENCSYSIASKNDVFTVLQLMIDVVVKVVIPYLDKHSNIQAIDKLLNDNPKKHTPFDGRGWSRYANALIVGDAVGRDNIHELIELYRGKVAAIDRGFYLSKFDEICCFLKNK